MFMLVIQISISIDLTTINEADNVFLELKNNDAIKREAVITIDNPSTYAIAEDYLTLEFNEICGKVIDYEILLYQLCPYEVSTPIYEVIEICQDTIIDNKTLELKNVCDTKQNLIRTDTEILYEFDYCKTDNLPIGVKDYKIKADVEYGLCNDGFGYEIDFIPILYYDNVEYRQEKWAWWNTTYYYCRNVTITNNVASTLTNFPVLLNITNTSNMEADLDDLRILNESCSFGGVELDYEIDTIQGDSALVWVKIPSFTLGNNVIGMYYNNSDVVAGENPNGVWDNDYLVVYHFSKYSGANWYDSTLNSMI